MTENKRVALVTGGNRGIGYELVKQLAVQGFQVILTSRDVAKGQEAAEKLKASDGLDVAVVGMDVDDAESIGQAARAIEEEYGRVDVLINNAGVYLDEQEGVLTMEPSLLERTMATNFWGPYHVLRAVIPLMEKQGYGRVINISSEWGAMREMSARGAGAYKLSKLALNGLTLVTAAEVQGDIKINAVDPGWVRTDMGGHSAPRMPKQAAEGILWLATVGQEGPNGEFFRDGKRIDW